MSNIQETVDLYLKMSTNYALMITGGWGSGKTFFYKNVLKEKISQTPTFHDKSKNYKPLLISLFGTKSVDEIQTQILLASYPILNNKHVKLASNIGKGLLKHVLSDNFADAKIDLVEWLNFEDFVICFDDLERKSKELNLEEAIGFINTLVENDNIKILIIANEVKILDDNYKTIKEKVIGNTIEFSTNLPAAYDNIIGKYSTDEPQYFNFLKEKSKTIIAFFENHGANLRILIFTLNYYNFIFNCINNLFTSTSSLSKIEQDIHLDVLKFSLCISFEYRNGQIDFKDRKEINRNRDLGLERFFKTNEHQSKEKPNYSDIFFEKYYNQQKYFFFEPIYDFITGGGALKEEALKAFLLEIYHIQDKAILPQYELLNQLSFPNCCKFSNKEYLKHTRTLYRFSIAGDFGLVDSLTAFYYILRFGNPLNYDINKLKEKIISGMKLSTRDSQFHSHLADSLTISEESIHYEHSVDIRNAALVINEELRTNYAKERREVITKLFYDDFGKFIETVSDRNEGYRITPFFMDFNPKEFYSFLSKRNNAEIFEITKFFTSRYDSPHSLGNELPFFKELLKLFSKTNFKQNQKGLSGYMWDELTKIIKKITEKLAHINHPI